MKLHLLGILGGVIAGVTGASIFYEHARSERGYEMRRLLHEKNIDIADLVYTMKTAREVMRHIAPDYYEESVLKIKVDRVIEKYSTT